MKTQRINFLIRKIVAWEVWTEENVELASELVDRVMLSEKVKRKNNKKLLVLHLDKGAPMKSYTLKAKLEVPGVISSYFITSLFFILF
ncbi:hypothetical protein E5347_02375 [Clostridium sartagoforme]|uniref:Uncharacterized protein n=1 Tax=Clostridium sartagoforme TaxID=84031 RepID=A0A4V3RLG6_9CLOT|nr:hypothetical protein [Clostridium sartagoforme]TGY43680.1 hypothetical protein E5347_02375 [Clostridium sartagoforme]